VDRPWLRIAEFLAVCLAVGMVVGACRATTLGGILKRMVEQFVSMAVGIVAICVAIVLLSLVAQA
jgi:hypothetical protein